VNNEPAGEKIKLLPDSIELRFDVPLQKYNEINGSMFSVSVNYDTVKANPENLIPRLDLCPKFIYNLKISPLKLDYLK
jgi:hypothetical protein